MVSKINDFSMLVIVCERQSCEGVNHTLRACLYRKNSVDKINPNPLICECACTLLWRVTTLSLFNWMAASTDFKLVIFEGDAKVVIDAISSPSSWIFILLWLILLAFFL
jgi:hypothetical protein